MAVSKTIRRLLRVLDLEEELRRRQLEFAQANLAQLDWALKAAGEREREGRLLFSAGAWDEDLSNRLAGQAEMHAGRRRESVLRQHIEQSKLVVDGLRAAFLEKRVERKQAETFIKRVEARESLEEDRRTQRSLDTGYLMRTPANKSDAKRNERESAGNRSSDDHV